MADVFLSYARGNHNYASLVAAKLQSNGYSVWFDEHLPAHRAYADVIEEQLEAAKAVVVIWSSQAAGSQWVRSEANRARETGRLVQLRVDDARLPMPFDQIQCADLRAWNGKTNSQGWKRVAASVAALVGADGRIAPTELPTGQPPIGRRHLLIGACAAAATTGVAGYFWWQHDRRAEMSPEAQLLMQKGFNALQENDALNPDSAGSTLQAIALLTQATDASPQTAIAWGGLALAYAVRRRAMPPAERPPLESKSRAAAAKALELDPSEGRALGALRLLDPVYRNWLAAEREDREAVRKNSKIPLLLSILADLLGNAGRWSEAVAVSSHVDRRNFLIPGADRGVIIDLWSSGDVEGADRALQESIEHWPEHPDIWNLRTTYLMYTGRPGTALDLLRSPDRPPQISGELAGAMQGVAGALAGTTSLDRAVSQLLSYLRNHPKSALDCAIACSALGLPDPAFAILSGYYFKEGQWAAIAPIGGDQDRRTSALFQPPMRTLWRDARFADLSRRIGLEDYWRMSRKVPDFRRT